MNIFEEFRSAAASANNADVAARGGPAVSVSNNNQVPNDATPKSDGKGPAAFPKTDNLTEDKSPLSGFTKLWENDPNKPKPNNVQDVLPKFNTDPAKLAEAVKGMDFAKVVPPEVAAAAMKGDPAAFAQALNAVTQQAFLQSANATTKIVENAVAQTANKMLTDVLPRMMKEANIANHVNSENPLLSNPAAAPLVDMVRSQVQSKFPSASAAEVHSQVSSYLADFAKLITDSKIGAAPDTSVSSDTVGKKTGGASDNWEDFFGVQKQ